MTASVPKDSTLKHVQSRFDNIVKSTNDKRDYRGLILNNQMKVLLISDPTTDKSAASLDVNVGKSMKITISIILGIHNFEF